MLVTVWSPERTLTILEGSTFVVCDDRGDVLGGTQGLFAEDTRALSRFELRIGGARPLLLSSGRVEYFSAAFYLRNAPGRTVPPDALSVARHRFVGSAMRDVVTVVNETMAELAFDVELTVAADFADILTVKERDLTLGHPDAAPPLPPCGAVSLHAGGRELRLAEGGGGSCTQVFLSHPCSLHGDVARFDVGLRPHERWQLTVDVAPRIDEQPGSPPSTDATFGTELERVRESLTAWRLRQPRVRSTWEDVTRSLEQSVADLAALRLRSRGTLGRLPAAGMPWFMTVFGRDTLITCLQSMLLGPELARSALEALASMQATADDPSIDAEPGKILHELRRGSAARTWFSHYYGTVDATPLFLVLLSETWRWTDDGDFARRMRPHALRALAWIDDHGDRDGDGFVEYERRTTRGLANQSWKDSGDSQRFADGTYARTPIAPVEVQGYVYDAKRRTAEMAREAWREPDLADRLEQEADALRARFDEAFWVDERGGFYALALDAGKRRVDSLCSNIGHLLWSGIVPASRVDQIVDRLLSDELWSGWGVRTMSTRDAAYSPISYHCGTVWPHDTSLAAAGLARYGRWEEAWTLARALFAAAAHFDYSLPEVFAGYTRSETPFPIAYPTATKPQAWAAAAPVLALQLLLGIRPDRRRHRLVSDAPGDLPGWVGTLELSDTRAFDTHFDIRVEPGSAVTVAAH